MIFDLSMRATPFTLTSDAFAANPMAAIGATDGQPAGPREDYDQRASMLVSADTHEGVLETVFERFQNLSEDHTCPDGGRSMMCGDLIWLVDTETRVETWWRVAALGFERLPSEVWMAGVAL